MKLLLDECMDARVVRALMAAGFDALSVSLWQPGADDQAVLSLAFQEQRVLITLDRDFGRLVILDGQKHAGILRLRGFSGHEEPAACLRALAKHEEDLESGLIVTFEPDKSRIRE